MARDLKAKIRLEADTKQANKALKGTSKSIADLGTSVLGAVGGFAAFTKALTFAVGAAIEQERAIAALNNQLRALGPAANEVSKALQEQASALQQVSTFGDEQIIQAQARIAAFTKEEDQIKGLTEATIDFAAAKGVDLNTAAELISKTFGSSTNALSRYGVEVEGAAGSTERLLSVTTNLADLFGGAALAQANTFGGVLQSLANNAGDAAENIAEFGTQNSLLIVGLQEGNRAIAEYNAEVDQAEGFWSKFGKTISPVLTTIGKFVPAFDLSRQALNLFNGVVGDETPKAIDKATDAVNNLQNALDIEKAVESTLEQLRKLGVVLDQDVNGQFEKNADLLLRTDELYRRGIITRREFEATEAAVAESNRKLTDTLFVQADALELSESGTLTYAEALKIARAELDGLTEAEIRNGDTVVSQSERRRAARAQENDDSLLGENTPIGGTFFFPGEVRVAQNGVFGAPLARL